MTTAHRTRSSAGEDAAISTAVRALLHAHGESVADLSYHTRISVASLYRKLGGEASWKAGDVGVVARHYNLSPGDLFSGLPIGGQPGTPGEGGTITVRHQGLEPRTRWFKDRARVPATSRVMPGFAVDLAA